jgi:hypothetical protein
MIIHLESDTFNWFYTEVQTYVSRQAECTIQIRNLTSDWNDEDSPKGKINFVVDNKCPYFEDIG